MKTPLTVYFNRSSIPLTRVDRPPFIPQYGLPFIPEKHWENYIGEGCGLIYRMHDGYNVHVVVLEAYVDAPKHTALEIPMESLLNDLHLLYQLDGTSGFPGLTLPAGHHTQIYAPPSRGTALVMADPDTHRYASCVIVPKGKWVSRDISDPKNPLFQLIGCLKNGHRESRYLAPTAMSAHVRSWIHLLLTTRAYPRLMMDNALNHPMGNLLEVHLRECGRQMRRTAAEEKSRALVDSARTMAAELLGRLRDGRLPELADIARTLGTTPAEIRKQHYDIYRQKFNHYVVHCRIDEAKKRLYGGDSIGSVAFALGWTDDTYFIKQFKKHTGMTPGQFLKNG